MATVQVHTFRGAFRLRPARVATDAGCNRFRRLMAAFGTDLATTQWVTTGFLNPSPLAGEGRETGRG